MPDLAELVAVADGLRDLAELLAGAAGLHDLAELVAGAAGLHDLAELVAGAAGLCDLAELVAVAAGQHDLVVVAVVPAPPCQNSTAAPSGGLIPCRFRVPPPGWRSSYGWGRMGACMNTSDQNHRATLDGLRATSDKNRLPGPRDAEVRPLSDLVDMLEVGLGIEPLEARRVAFDMLSGAVGDGFDWQGSPAHQLPLFQLTSLGTFEVSSAVPRLNDGGGVTVYTSERQRALAKFLEGEPTPWLVVRYADALEALGVNELRRSLPPPPAKEEAKGGASSQGYAVVDAVANEPATIEQQPQETWQQRALAMHAEGKRPTAIAKVLGLAALLGAKHEDTARKKVERLIKRSEKQEIERKKAEAFKQQLANL